MPCRVSSAALRRFLILRKGAGKARDHLLVKADNTWNNLCMLTINVENWSLEQIGS